MNTIIYEKLNPLVEAYLLLSKLMNDEGPSFQQENLQKLNMLKAEVLIKQLDLPVKIYALVKEKSSAHFERLTFFFKNWENPNFSLASLLFVSTLDASFEERLHFLQTCSPEERFNFLKECMLCSIHEYLSPSTSLDPLNIENEKELFDCIESVKELSYEHKYHLLMLYYHFDSLLEELHSLLLETACMIEPFLDDMQGASTAFIQNLKKEVAESDLSFLEQELNISVDSTELKIYPTFTGFNLLTLENFLGTGPFDHMFLGIYLLEIIRLKNESVMDEKNLVPFLKAIADPSKLEILKLLKNEKLYSSQLAERLQISNATISHHVSTLLNLELVTFTKEQTKIYFFLNKEKIQSYLSSLQRVFE